MATELELRYLINLAGNILDRTGQYTRAFAGMEQRTSQSMSKMERSLRVVGDGIDKVGNRYTAFLTGAVGVEAVRSTIKMDERLTRLGISANRSAAEMESLKKEIFETAQKKDIAVPVDELVAGLETIRERTGDLDFARKNIENIGMAISATGQSGEVIGELISAMQKFGITTRDDVLTTMNQMNETAKFSGLSFADLSEQVKQAAPAYAALGRTGVTAWRELSAAMSEVAKGTRSPQQAAESFNMMLAAITDKDKRRMLQNAGINVFDPKALKEGKEVLEPINDIMTEIVEKSKAKRTQLSLIFDERGIQAMNALAEEWNRTGAQESMHKIMDVEAKQNSLLDDSRRHATTAAAAVTNLKNSWDDFADDNLTQPIQSLADAIHGIKPDELKTAYTWLMRIGEVVGTIYVGRKLLNMAYGAKDFLGYIFKGGAKDGLGKPGVTPVYVVNMPGGGLGGMPGTPGEKIPLPDAKEIGYFSKEFLTQIPVKDLLKLGLGARLAVGGYLGASAYVGYETGSYLRDNTRAGMTVEDAIGHGFAKTRAIFGDRDAAESIAMRDKFEREGRLHIQIETKDGTKATVSRMEAPSGTQLDVGHTTHMM